MKTGNVKKICKIFESITPEPIISNKREIFEIQSNVKEKVSFYEQQIEQVKYNYSRQSQLRRSKSELIFKRSKNLLADEESKKDSCKSEVKTHRQFLQDLSNISSQAEQLLRSFKERTDIRKENRNELFMNKSENSIQFHKKHNKSKEQQLDYQIIQLPLPGCLKIPISPKTPKTLSNTKINYNSTTSDKENSHSQKQDSNSSQGKHKNSFNKKGQQPSVRCFSPNNKSPVQRKDISQNTRNTKISSPSQKRGYQSNLQEKKFKFPQNENQFQKEKLQTSKTSPQRKSPSNKKENQQQQLLNKYQQKRTIQKSNSHKNLLNMQIIEKREIKVLKRSASQKQMNEKFEDTNQAQQSVLHQLSLLQQNKIQINKKQFQNSIPKTSVIRAPKITKQQVAKTPLQPKEIYQSPQQDYNFITLSNEPTPIQHKLSQQNQRLSNEIKDIANLNTAQLQDSIENQLKYGPSPLLKNTKKNRVLSFNEKQQHNEFYEALYTQINNLVPKSPPTPRNNLTQGIQTDVNISIDTDQITIKEKGDADILALCIICNSYISLSTIDIHSESCDQKGSSFTEEQNQRENNVTLQIQKLAEAIDLKFVVENSVAIQGFLFTVRSFIASILSSQQTIDLMNLLQDFQNKIMSTSHTSLGSLICAKRAINLCQEKIQELEQSQNTFSFTFIQQSNQEDEMLRFFPRSRALYNANQTVFSSATELIKSTATQVQEIQSDVESEESFEEDTENLTQEFENIQKFDFQSKQLPYPSSKHTRLYSLIQKMQKKQSGMALFYNIALNIKCTMKYKREVKLSDIYRKALKQKLPESEWVSFIKEELGVEQ